MKTVKVKNIHNTSKKRYSKSYPKGYSSWIDYWEKKCIDSRLLLNCANIDCENPYKVGAHVIKEISENDRNWYIVPLCKTCNHPDNDKYFKVNERFLVPVSEKDAYIENEDEDIDDF